MKAKTTTKTGGGKAAPVDNNAPASDSTGVTPPIEIEPCTAWEKTIMILHKAGASYGEVREFIRSVPADEVEELRLFCKANPEITGGKAIIVFDELSWPLSERLGTSMSVIKHLHKTGASYDKVREIIKSFPADEVEGLRLFCKASPETTGHAARVFEELREKNGGGKTAPAGKAVPASDPTGIRATLKKHGVENAPIAQELAAATEAEAEAPRHAWAPDDAIAEGDVVQDRCWSVDLFRNSRHHITFDVSACDEPGVDNPVTVGMTDFENPIDGKCELKEIRDELSIATARKLRDILDKAIAFVEGSDA